MIAVLIVVVAVFVVIAAVVGFFLLRRSPQAPAKSKVEGEPPASTATATPPVETPTVEQLEEMFEAPAAPEVLERPRLRDRLGRTRSAFTGAFGRIRGRTVDAETWDELEEALLLADVGMATTQRLLDAVRTRAKEQSVTEPDDLIALVREEVTSMLHGDGTDRSLHIVGGRAERVDVRGRERRREDHDDREARVARGRRRRRVVLAAADTFHAAAADQLQLWAERTGGEIVRGQEGADPGLYRVRRDGRGRRAARPISSSSTPRAACTRRPI